MAEIFVSYATEDRERARSLAQALEERGWDVWWDREIPLGTAYDDAIEQALASARCAIVLWSRTSIASEWVRSEASEAKRRGILVPVFLEPVDPPLAFRLVHGADLATWEPGAHHDEFETLVRRVGELLGQPLPASGHIPGPVTHGPRGRVRTGMGRWSWWVAAAGALALLVAGLSMAGVWSRPRSADPTSSVPSQQGAKSTSLSSQQMAPKPTPTDPSDLTSALQNALSAIGNASALTAATVFEFPEIAVKVMFVSEEQASTLKHLGLQAGAVVIGVGKGPALRAGLQAGDVLISIGGAPIKTADDLRQAARRVGPGKTRYGVRRNDRTIDIDIECPDCTTR